MENQNNDVRNIILGVAIGGIIGGSALYLLKSIRKHNKPVISKIGKTISDFGEMLEDSGFEDKKDAMHEIEKSIPKGDNWFNDALNWAATGITLWKKIKRGN